MDVGTGAAAADVAEAITATLDRLFSDLAPLHEQVATLYADRTPATADLDGLRDRVLGVLDAGEGLAVGAGFVAGPGALTNGERCLAWWTTASGAVRRLPSATDAFDFTRQPWFTVPAATGRAHVTGPYVDYFCTDDYTLTLSVPVRSGERCVGVVGTDVFVARIERLFLPDLRQLGPRAAVVNARGRVVVSTSVTETTGSILRSHDVPALRASGAPGPVVWCGDHPLGVVVT